MLKIPRIFLLKQLCQLLKTGNGILSEKGTGTGDDSLHLAHTLKIGLPVHRNKMGFPDAFLLVGMGILGPGKGFLGQFIH